MSLHSLGWSTFFENQKDGKEKTDLLPGRIIARHANFYVVRTEKDEGLGEISGRLYHKCRENADYPVVGDWVLVSLTTGDTEMVIHEVLLRKTSISRGAAGTAGKREGKGAVKEQVIAANIDTLFIVMALDRDYNLRRIERYLTMAYNSGANPVILLNKSDLEEDPASKVAEVESIAFGVPVHAVSAGRNLGIDLVSQYIKEGETAAFMGSSGVGKSSIINRILGYERQKTREISSSVRKGVHTTTHREIIMLENGGLVLDNPGMRELTLWATEKAVDNLFEDVEALAVHCRFSDCHHESEPECAVQKAIDKGELDQSRLAGYLKLKKEESFFEQRQSKSADAIEKDKWRPIKMQIRRHYKKGKG